VNLLILKDSFINNLIFIKKVIYINLRDKELLIKSIIKIKVLFKVYLNLVFNIFLYIFFNILAKKFNLLYNNRLLIPFLLLYLKPLTYIKDFL
jgi:hypothetical protein